MVPVAEPAPRRVRRHPVRPAQRRQCVGEGRASQRGHLPWAVRAGSGLHRGCAEAWHGDRQGRGGAGRSGGDRERHSPPHTQILSRKQLGEQYGITAYDVAVALQPLVDEGLLTTHGGRGTYVAERPQAGD
ncbi:GntR family transcriptional regulator [Streptomyces scabiei]|uniref:GntR family transcriptional regulator n=1 Tax=Streptomyces scabiei TaxID=1930 RepID=UPI0035AB8758